MIRLFVIGAAGALVLSSASAAVAAPVGPDAAACRPGAAGPAVLVNLATFKSRRGMVRVQVHGSDGATFLQNGAHLKRIEVPVAASGPMAICVRLPAPGRYAVAVQHRTSHAGGWNPVGGNDGGGFSRNPRLSVSKHRPSYGEVAIDVGNMVQPVDVLLYYRYGFTIRPAQ